MSQSGSGGRLIDDEGNLFGRVNIVDALVVALVLAVVVAGVALVTGERARQEPAPDPGQRHYATVTFTVPLESDAATIGVNDTLKPIGGGDNFTVSETVRSFASNGRAHVTATIAYRGAGVVRGSVLYGGTNASFRTETYQFGVSVLETNRTDGTLQTRRVPVVVSTSRTVARTLEPGDEARIGGDTVAEVQTVSIPANENRSALVGLELVAWDRGSTAEFGGRAVRVGTNVTAVTSDTIIRGQVREVGSADPSDV